MIPGKYSALLVLYQVNELGTYDDIDAIFPAFQFEIINSEMSTEINWNASHWGKIRFDDLKLEGD